MKDVAAVIGVVVASLAIVGAAVFAGGDRSLFVPGPEVVAESFTHQITTERYDLARRMLSGAVAQAHSPRALAERFVPLFAVTGEVNSVEAEPTGMDRHRATARATVVGDRGRVSFDVGLVRERGLWRIETLPDLR